MQRVHVYVQLKWWKFLSIWLSTVLASGERIPFQSFVQSKRPHNGLFDTIIHFIDIIELISFVFHAPMFAGYRFAPLSRSSSSSSSSQNRIIICGKYKQIMEWCSFAQSNLCWELLTKFETLVTNLFDVVHVLSHSVYIYNSSILEYPFVQLQMGDRQKGRRGQKKHNLSRSEK